MLFAANSMHRKLTRCSSQKQWRHIPEPRPLGRGARDHFASDGPFGLALSADDFIISAHCFCIASLLDAVLEAAAECFAAARALLMASQLGPAKAVLAATPNETRTAILRTECMVVFPTSGFFQAQARRSPQTSRLEAIEIKARGEGPPHMGRIRFASALLRGRWAQALQRAERPSGKPVRRKALEEERARAQLRRAACQDQAHGRWHPPNGAHRADGPRRARAAPHPCPGSSRRKPPSPRSSPCSLPRAGKRIPQSQGARKAPSRATGAKAAEREDFDDAS